MKEPDIFDLPPISQLVSHDPQGMMPYQGLSISLFTVVFSV